MKTKIPEDKKKQNSSHKRSDTNHPSYKKELMFTIIFQRIIEGKYPVNLRLKENELAAEFNLSRTPVREVLRQLEQYGLIEILPRRGASIIPFSSDDIEEIYELRKTLEVLALRFAQPFLCLDRLNEIRLRIKELKSIKHSHNELSLDQGLHSYIVESCNKRRIQTILRPILRLMRSFSYLGIDNPKREEKAANDHMNILTALITGDYNKARHCLEEHIERSKKDAISNLFQL